MKFLKSFWKSKTFLSIYLGFLFSWFHKESITPLIFAGKGFAGRNLIYQSILVGGYSLIFAIACYSLITLLERLFSAKDNAEPKISKYYGPFILYSAMILLVMVPLKYVANMILFKYPLEYREAASLSAALDFSRGVNPYSYYNFPGHIYLYGFLYPFTLAPFINLGNNPLLISRIYNVFFLVLFLGMSFWIFRKRNSSIISSLIGCLLLLNSMCLIWIINGMRPDASGLFFSYLGFCFLLRKEPRLIDIILSALSCVIGFYFKQYFLFSALVSFIYLFFFISKQKGFTFLAAATILGMGSFLILRVVLPLLYEYSILHHIRVAGANIAYMESQSIQFIKDYWILILIYIYFVFRSVSAFNKKRIKEIRLSLFQVKEPFIRNTSINLFDAGILISLLILTFWLGKHDGNKYTYYGELLLPFLLFAMIPKIDALMKNNLSRILVQVFLLAFCAFPFLSNITTDFNSWNSSFSNLHQYAEQCKVIDDQTPLVAVYKLQHNMFPLYNNGHTEYAYSIIPDKGTFFGKFSLAPVDLLRERLLEWQQTVESKLKNRDFDCVFSDIQLEIPNYQQVAEVENVWWRTVYIYSPISSNSR